MYWQRKRLGNEQRIDNEHRIHNEQRFTYMSTQRKNFEGQTTARRAKRGGLWKGVRGLSPEIFQKPVLQMVQSELFLSYRGPICQYK